MSGAIAGFIKFMLGATATAGAAAIAAQLAALAWVSVGGPHGLVQPRPTCGGQHVCVVVAGLQDDVSLGFGAAGELIGLDIRDDTAQRLADDFSVLAADGRPIHVVRYPVEISVPQAGDPDLDRKTARAVSRAREIGRAAGADLVVIGRVVSDDYVALSFVDPGGASDVRVARIRYQLGNADSHAQLLQSLSASIIAVSRGEPIPEIPRDTLPMPETPRVTDAKPPSAPPDTVVISDPIAPTVEQDVIGHTIVPARLNTRITPEMAARYYPDQGRGEGGRASVRCQVAVNGALHGCAVLSETPDRRGFGRAALRVVERHTGTPEFRDAQAVPDGDVTVVVTFNPPSR
jgi:TonB family protein